MERSVTRPWRRATELGAAEVELSMGMSGDYESAIGVVLLIYSPQPNRWYIYFYFLYNVHRAPRHSHDEY